MKNGEVEQKISPTELDTVVNDQIKSYRSIVGSWMKGKTVKKTSSAAVQKVEPTNLIGRPPRLGIGAKVTSQKEQISNSVFLNQKLARTLTGQAVDAKPSSFMRQYSQSQKQPTVVKVIKENSEDEDSRSKSIGKRSHPSNSNQGSKHNQKKKR